MIIYAQQNGTGPIVSLPMGPGSAPASITEAPVITSLDITDLFLVARNGILNLFPFGDLTSSSGSAAAAAAVAAVSGSLSTLSTGLATETARAEAAEAANAGSITTIAGSVTTLSESVGGYSGSISTLEGSFSALSGSFTTISAEASGASGSISTLSAGLAAEIARAEAAEAALTGTISGLAGSITGYGTTITSLLGSFTTLSGSFSTVSSLASSFAGSITALSAGLASETANRMSEESALSSSISSLSGSISGAYAAAEAALPTAGGTLTGPLAFSASGTISTGNELYLSPLNQLWLGATNGGGAVYSATIGATTSNPGTLATNKLWNNGGAVALSSGAAALPNPAFAPTHVPSQAYADIAGSSSIFSHNGGVVPAPPSVLTGLLIGDKWKLDNVYNFGHYWAPQQGVDAWPALQNFLLYAQLMRIAQMGAPYDSVAEFAPVVVYLPPGDYEVSQPLIVPDGVMLHCHGRVVRVGYTGNQSNNGTTSVAGIFNTNQYLPTVVAVPRAHFGTLPVYVNGTGTFAARGSGVCIGKNWQAIVGGSVTIGSSGSGYSVGDIWVAANPSGSPYSGFVVNVTAVNGAGGITAGTIRLGGAYALPPATYNGGPSLQAQQWSAANNFTVFDPANAGAFLMQAAFRSDFSTPSPGTGATIVPPWQQDFETGGGQYMCGAALTNGTFATMIQVDGSVPDAYDNTGISGPTFNLMLSGLEMRIGDVRGLGGHAGIWATYAQDVRIGVFNTVESNIGFWARGAGSIVCNNVVLDTCGCILVIDQSHGINLTGRAFYEEGNIGVANPNMINAQSVPPSGGVNYAMIIGAASNTSYPNSDIKISFTVANMGGLPASTIAAKGLTGVSPSQQAAICYASYLFSSTIDLQVTNTSQYGGAPSLLPTSGIYQFGYGVDKGCVFLGSIDTVPTIDGVPPPAQAVQVTGSYPFPACGIRVWDGLRCGWIGPYNVVELFGAFAPSNGTTGTAAGLAMPGSTFVDTTPSAGRRYVNTGTQASPAWS